MRRHIRFVFLLVAGLVLLAACGRQTEPPTVNHEVTVTIVGNGRVVSSPAGIDTDAGDVTAAFRAGSRVTLTATPASGSNFDGFSFDDAALECEDGSTATTCVLTVDDAIDVTATFTAVVVVPGTETLTVEVEGNGRVVSDPVGIDTDVGDFTATFDEGEVVKLIATAAPGSEFVDFSFDDPDLECDPGSLEGECIIALDASIEVTVTFARLTQALSVTVVGDGEVVSDPPGIEVGPDAIVSADFDQGEVVKLTAIYEEESVDLQWTFADPDRDCEAGSTDGTCFITMDEDVGVTATFTPIMDDLTVLINVGMASQGAVESNPPGIDTEDSAFTASFQRGTPIILTATTDAPADGFAGWTGGACDGVKTVECTFFIGADEATITANFNVVSSQTIRIGDDEDDVEEFLQDSISSVRDFIEGYTYFISFDLELGYDPAHAPQAVGLRFTDVAVPRSANVLEARLGFTAYALPVTGSDGDVALSVTGHKTLNAPMFETDLFPDPGDQSTASFGLTGLPQTTAIVGWTIDEEWIAEESYQSSDLASIVQELVDQEGWIGTSAMAFIIEPVDPTSTEYRRAYSHTEDPAKAATLTLTWVALPPPLP